MFVIIYLKKIFILQEPQLISITKKWHYL